jgi:hypothetical protein
MKLKALRSFRWKDNLREVMINIQKGQTFEADVEKDCEQIYGAVQGGMILIIDEAFIPGRATYIGLRNYDEERADGTRLRVVPGQPLTLNQSEASRLMGGAFAKPEKENQWRPQWLLTGSVSAKPPKRMFDDPEPKKNFATDYKVRKGVD